MNSVEIKKDFDSLLKGLIIPSKGKDFFVGDLKSIEAKLSFYVSRDFKTCGDFNNGIDLYKKFGESLDFKFESDKIRQIGKLAILGLGYGMGKDKFFETSLKPNGINDFIVAEKTVNHYRKTYSKICDAWRNCENNFIKSWLDLQNSKKSQLEKDFFYLQLLNGKKLFYPKTEVINGKISYQTTRQKVYLWGGTIFENLIQGLAREVIVFMLLEMQRKKLDVKFTVHDSIIVEIKNDKEYNLCEKIMNTNPSFIGKEIKITSDCKRVSRYE